MVNKIKDTDTKTTTGKRFKMFLSSASACPEPGAALLFARSGGRGVQRVILKLAPSHHNEKANKSN